MPYAPETAHIATPIGTVAIDGDDTRLHAIRILGEKAPPRRSDYPAILAAAEQLEAWFDGALTRFDLALMPVKSERGQQLREGLMAIPHGETISYGGLARLLGSGPRAIGQLCARNPFPIVVPCHRVLAADGLGQYSGGGGLVAKQWLLNHERGR